jgi:hypothetical protein
MKRSIAETREGFQVTEKQFAVPENTTDLDPRTKKAVTICNLFLNEKLTISDMIRVLDEDYGSIVLALLEEGVIKERRLRQAQPPQGTERRRSDS